MCKGDHLSILKPPSKLPAEQTSCLTGLMSSVVTCLPHTEPHLLQYKSSHTKPSHQQNSIEHGVSQATRARTGTTIAYNGLQDKMASHAKRLAAIDGGQSSTPGIHLKKRQNRLRRVAFCLLKVHSYTRERQRQAQAEGVRIISTLKLHGATRLESENCQNIK